jgi:hypothetical protein
MVDLPLRFSRLFVDLSTVAIVWKERSGRGCSYLMNPSMDPSRLGAVPGPPWLHSSVIASGRPMPGAGTESGVKWAFKGGSWLSTLDVTKALCCPGLL